MHIHMHNLHIYIYVYTLEAYMNKASHVCLSLVPPPFTHLSRPPPLYTPLSSTPLYTPLSRSFIVDDNEEEAGGSKKEKVRISRDERKLDDDDYSLIQVANPPTDALVLENALALALTPGLLPSLSCCLPVPVVLLPRSLVAEDSCASRSPRLAVCCSLLDLSLLPAVYPNATNPRSVLQRHNSPQ